MLAFESGAVVGFRLVLVGAMLGACGNHSAGPVGASVDAGDRDRLATEDAANACSAAPCPVTLFSGGVGESIAVDSTTIYWTNGNVCPADGTLPRACARASPLPEGQQGAGPRSVSRGHSAVLVIKMHDRSSLTTSVASSSPARSS